MKNLYLTTFALTVPRRIRQKPYPHIICLLIESLERADPIQQCPQRCPPDSIMKLPNNFPRTARKAVIYIYILFLGLNEAIKQANWSHMSNISLQPIILNN